MMQEHQEHAKKVHQKTLTEVSKLKELEARIHSQPFPPKDPAGAKKLDGLLGEFQTQHKVVQDHIVEVRQSLAPMIAG